MDESGDMPPQPIFNDGDLKLLMEEVSRKVLEEKVYTKADNNIGDHVCPVVDVDGGPKFADSGKLTKLLEAIEDDLKLNYVLDNNWLAEIQQGLGSIALAISNPQAVDCPLIFVSRGFAELTGYTNDVIAGRSCRFLQPTSRLLNDGVNLNERKIMREFCAEIQPVGTTIINLLMNERINGQRFWNLLRMKHVEVDGERYIYGVQSTLQAFMPTLLTKFVETPSKNAKIVDALGDFIHALDNLRNDMRKKHSKPLKELKFQYTNAMDKLRLTGGDAPKGLATRIEEEDDHYYWMRYDFDRMKSPQTSVWGGKLVRN